jgi:bifunctional UDP-N-acetylglucosamine pyrophosphorylase/glucosamine-1-phosphate N-acetyltransferase
MISNSAPVIRCVIAAAGQGTRSGLAYPKTLFEIKKKPILIRICELLSDFDLEPSIIISPKWEDKFKSVLANFKINAELIPQTHPTGMGDALLQFEKSKYFNKSEHLILIWGDIPFLKAETMQAMVSSHILNQNAFTFPTRDSIEAYTYVSRDETGNVNNVIETRELGIADSSPGERDIGLFIFKKDLIFSLLKEDLPNKFGNKTKEHGFLYIVKHLYKKGYKVEALKIAAEQDLISFNSMEDIDTYL